jgi:hypothetical protein
LDVNRDGDGGWGGLFLRHLKRWPAEVVNLSFIKPASMLSISSGMPPAEESRRFS